MKLKVLLLLTAFFLIHLGMIGEACAYQGPDDSKAVEEARKAVERLGPGRGAIPLTGKVIGIVGIIPSSLSATSIKIGKALKDLGARQVGTEIQLSLSGDILFDYDKWDIKEEAEETLMKLARGIKELGKDSAIIEGHTDSKGSEDYNLILSRKRAASVKEWFVANGGLEEVDFQTKGYGEEKPVAPNTNPDGSDNPQGRAKNRRVEIRIPG